MREAYYWEAIREALRHEMARDERVVLLGEDIGAYGGAFKVTRGLLDEFGPERVIDTPISEAAVTGICAGAAMTGMRPVMEIMFMDFITLAFDQLLNHAAKYRYMYGGAVKVPMVIRTPTGGGRGYGATHSQSLESWTAKIPGVKVVAPAFCEDARGMLISAIRDDNPVVFVEHKKLYGTKGELGDEAKAAPLEKARVVKEGSDVTVISYSWMLHRCLEAARELEKEGVSCRVLDLRSLKPLDEEAVFEAVEATGRVVLAEEGVRTMGIGAELAARIAEECLFSLDAPPVRVAAPDTHIPCSPPLEKAVIPGPAAVIQAVRRVMSDE